MCLYMTETNRVARVQAQTGPASAGGAGGGFEGGVGVLDACDHIGALYPLPLVYINPVFWRSYVCILKRTPLQSLLQLPAR